MQLSTLFLTSLALAPSLVSAAVVPNITSNDVALAKRGVEVNYLVNCNAPYKVSHIAWYPNIDDSQSGQGYWQYPGSVSNEYRDWSKGGDWLTWEGLQQNIYFADSGVTIQTHIQSGASSFGFKSYAGWIQRTSDWKAFTCYRDNNRQLFSSNGLTCQSIYWCT